MKPLPDLLRFWARWQADAVAVLTATDSLTWQQLDRRSDDLAGGLLGVGVCSGDVVGVYMTNRTEYIESAMAVLKIGAVVAPLNPRYVANELSDAVSDAKMRCLFTEAKLFEKTSEVPGDCAVFVCGSNDGNGDFERLRCKTDIELPSYSADDAAFTCYTSGTTGRPKGVVLSHANVWAAAVQRMPLEGLSVGTRVLLPTPLAYTGGLIVSFMELTLTSGATLVMQQDFDPEQCLEAIERQQIQFMNVASPVLARLAESPAFDSTDLSSLRSVCIGGAPVSETTLTAFNSRRVAVSQSYGQTEAAGGLTFLAPHESARKLGSSGLPHMFTELRLVDENGDEVGQGSAGEIVARGPQVMIGYLGDPEATSQTIRNGWLHTGDLGVFDSEGYLTVVGRSSDTIISGGLNIYPAEIERVVARVPGISEAVVVGIADEKWGETPLLIVSEAPGPGLSIEMLRGALKSDLADYKRPRHVARIAGELPRTTSGKVDRTALKSLIAEVSRKATPIWEVGS